VAIPSETLVWTSKSDWGTVEVGAIRSRLTEAGYEHRKREMVEMIRKARSTREEEEAWERDRQAQQRIRLVTWADDYFKAYYKNEAVKLERQERMKDLDLRHKAWVLRKINSPPRSQEEMNRRFDRWEIQGISRDEGNRLARMYGFPERPPILHLIYQPALTWPPPRLEERLPLPVLSYDIDQMKPPPKDEAEMEQRFRYWDGRLSRAEQNELARMYGFGERKRQRKTYTKERASRRLAGKLPEHGMLPGRGDARPLQNASLPSSSNTAPQMRSLDTRTGKAPRKLATIAGSKPQGISKLKKQPGATAGRSSRRLARS
jgi:hypothetical protein